MKTVAELLEEVRALVAKDERTAVAILSQHGFVHELDIARGSLIGCLKLRGRPEDLAEAAALQKLSSAD
jgi:hypothetical protein